MGQMMDHTLGATNCNDKRGGLLFASIAFMHSLCSWGESMSHGEQRLFPFIRGKIRD